MLSKAAAAVSRAAGMVGGAIGKGSTLEKLREKYPNAGRAWTSEDDAQLREMFAENKPHKDIATHFARKPSAIRARLGHLGLIENHWVIRRKKEKQD